MLHSLLVIGEDPGLLGLFQQVFAESEIEVICAPANGQAIQIIDQQSVSAVVLDISQTSVGGLAFFEQIQGIDPQLPVVIVTSGHDSQTAIRAMQMGALDYLVKPFDVRALNKAVRQAVEVRRLMVEPVALESGDESQTGTGSLMIGSCPAMQEVYKAIGRVASQNISVLIRGESGTGKELVARAIYQNGLRSDKPFLAINCAAIPDTLLESELFGHEKGSFTGADRRRIGKIEQCNGGTLFLDEIGDMDSALQSKVLRVLQEKQFERVGGSETLRADVRILAATHRDLEQMCLDGHFREDLFYRLNGYTVDLPPLRDRGSDLELLIEFFRRTANRELGQDIKRIDPDAIELLKQFHWPGNVRQLQSVIFQAVLQSSGTVLLADFLPPLAATRFPAMASAPNGRVNVDAQRDGAEMSPYDCVDIETIDNLIDRFCRSKSTTLYDDVLEVVERKLIARILKELDGNQSQAAIRLGISRTTLRAKMEKLRIGLQRISD